MSDNHHGYIRRVDAVRVLLMAAVILSMYRLPLPLTRYFALLCSFAPSALFALYGYFALRSHSTSRSLKYSLFSAVRVFFVLLIAYLVLGCFYQWLNTGNPTSWLNMPNLLTFLVFNKWPINLGDSIWMIQSVLYALIVFTVFRRFSHSQVLDCVVCGVLMLSGIVFSEFAPVLHLPFYIERNFLTTTIPYMLLGKLIHYAPPKLREISGKKLIIIFCGGVALCAAEALLHRQLGTLDYCQHLLGFIPMTFATVLFAVRGPQKTKIDRNDIRLMTVYRYMYYLFNPVAEFYFLLTIFLIGFPKVFNVLASATAIVTPVVSFLLAWAVSKFISRRASISRNAE